MSAGTKVANNTVFQLKKGLDLPISGQPEQKVVDGPAIKTVALVGDDYVGMKPTMAVQEGDSVRLGQLLFEDKKNEGVRFLSPAAGKVLAVNRGAKRKFESIVIEIDGEAAETFPKFDDHYLHNVEREKIVENLLASGLWSALRTRPYGKNPSPTSSPNSLFITAIDTNPLAADPSVVLKLPEYDRWFTAGMQALSTLPTGPTFLSKGIGANIPGSDQECVVTAQFAGPHPAGLPGTHIHLLDPVNENKTNWYVGYQDVVAIGHLFLTGTLMTERIVSVAGPAVSEPKLVRSRVGAAIGEITAGFLPAVDEAKYRVISGSALSGRIAKSPVDYLGRFHNQVTVLQEGNQRDLLGWAMPGFKKFSVTRAFASAFGKSEDKVPFTTSTEGSVRAIVPIGSYERVMPLDIVATPLMKALAVQDTDTAAMLGCLELEEEDLALCTFACPGKNDYGSLLRKCLTHIEREG